MTTSLEGVGAVSHIDQWKSIDWKSIDKEVRRLQMRIVKAQQGGQWGKVHALQHLLTHSFSGKALAVRRVTSNQGRRTPGVDQVLWNTTGKKMAAIQTLQPRGYRPQPLRRLYIPKANGKKRPLGIPIMRDRAMQALYLLALDPLAEVTADPNSYGFRKARCCADALEQCFKVLSKRSSPRWVLEGDIRSCFDEISHAWLLTHIPMDSAVLRKWLAAGYIERHVFHHTTSGTPQGGVISPVLANMALDGLEPVLRAKFSKRGLKVNLVRYADDFIITGSSEQLLAEKIRPFVESFLHERGLILSDKKTVITRIEDGFDFLGQNVRKYREKLLITPAKSNVKKFLQKIREEIKRLRQATAPQMIGDLNAMIRGWANYHRHVVSKATFIYVDHVIFQALWRWAVRRHPKKCRRWVKAKYFGTLGGNNWRFFGRHKDSTGSQITNWLFLASSLPIQRHLKVRSAANPYDREWETYFRSREAAKGHRRRLSSQNL